MAEPSKPVAPKPPTPFPPRRASRGPALPAYKPPAAVPASPPGFVSGVVRTGGIVTSGSTEPRPKDAPPAVAVHPFDAVRRFFPQLRTEKAEK